MPRSDLFSDSYTGEPRRRGPLASISLVIALIGFGIGLFFVGEYFQRYATYRQERASDPGLPPVSPLEPVRNIALNTLYELPRPIGNQALLESGLRVYDLQIATKHLATIQQTAERVTARTVAVGVPREYVPARFRSGNESWPVQVKLRGLMSLHYLKMRPSLRVKFPRDRLFEGKRQINLSDPYDKGLTIDATTNRELERYGILTWDSRFVIVRVNDELQGLFQEIEQFGRSMADRTGRPEGFIFSGDGQLFGSEGPGYDKARGAIERVMACRQGGEPGADGCGWDFFSSYFDVDRWAWAGAMIALLHSAHAWDGDNLRLFWDPARGKFEPVPWDYFYYPLDPGSADGEPRLGGDYAAAFYGIDRYRQERDSRLWILLNERVDPMIERARSHFEELAPALIGDVRHPSFELDRERQRQFETTLDGNRRQLRALLERDDLRARTWRTSAGLVVQIENHAKAFAEVTGLVASSARGRVSVPIDPLIVDGTWGGAPGRATLVIELPPGLRPGALEATNGVTGAPVDPGAIRIEAGSGPAPGLTATPAPALQIALDNVRVDADQVTFGPGIVHLARALEVPSSHDVVFAPGLDLRMGPGATLGIYGDLESVGRADAPVRISGAAKAPWGGIFVQGTRTEPRQVHLEHTLVVGGSGAQNARTWFTAPFAVHDGRVRIRESEFRDAGADDGINLKYCEVEIDDSRFVRALDDAVDCDFCRGVLRNNWIEDAGGDGLDFSGSDVDVEGNRIEGCGDKGMSVGERTVARISGNRIRGCRTGIAVKDLSNATIQDTRLEDLEVGLALYVKKPTFGPSHARLERVEMNNVATTLVRDASCTLEGAAHLEPGGA